MLSNQVAVDMLVGQLEKLWVELRQLRIATERLGDILKEEWVR